MSTLEERIKAMNDKPTLDDIKDLNSSIKQKRLFKPPMPSRYNSLLVQKENNEIDLVSKQKNQVEEYSNKKSLINITPERSPLKTLKKVSEHPLTPFSKLKYNDQGEQIVINEFNVVNKKDGEEEESENSEDEGFNGNDLSKVKGLNDSLKLSILSKKQINSKSELNEEENSKSSSCSKSSSKDSKEDESKAISQEEQEEQEENKIENEEMQEEQGDCEKKHIINTYELEHYEKDYKIKTKIKKTKSKDTNYTKTSISQKKKSETPKLYSNFEEYMKSFDDPTTLNKMTEANTYANSLPQNDEFDSNINLDD